MSYVYAVLAGFTAAFVVRFVGSAIRGWRLADQTIRRIEERRRHYHPCLCTYADDVCPFRINDRPQCEVLL